MCTRYEVTGFPLVLVRALKLSISVTSKLFQRHFHELLWCIHHLYCFRRLVNRRRHTGLASHRRWMATVQGAAAVQRDIALFDLNNPTRKINVVIGTHGRDVDPMAAGDSRAFIGIGDTDTYS